MMQHQHNRTSSQRTPHNQQPQPLSKFFPASGNKPACSNPSEAWSFSDTGFTPQMQATIE
jgi:hypothetical protein